VEVELEMLLQVQRDSTNFRNPSLAFWRKRKAIEAHEPTG
jgi:hypothetical protein